MPKIDLKNLSAEQANQLLIIIRKEIQSLDGDKERLISQINTLQKEANELRADTSNSRKKLKDKEDELIKKYELKETELGKKISEQNSLVALASSKNGEVDDLIAQNKKLDIQLKAQQDTVKVNDDAVKTILAGLRGIVKYVETEINKL